MNKLFIIILLLPMLAFAQKQDDVYSSGEKIRDTEAPKKANLIKVINERTAEENFISVKKSISDQNLEIANQDRDVYQVKTVIPRKKRTPSCTYLIKCSDKEIVITGTFSSGFNIDIGSTTISDEPETIANKGMSGSQYKLSFIAMDEFAKSLGTKISYSVR